MIRLGLRFGVEPVFIPKGEPQFNGGIENFNGWFQPRLFQRRFTRPGDLRRELARLQEAELGYGQTSAALHPRRMFDEGDIDGSPGEQASRQRG